MGQQQNKVGLLGLIAIVVGGVIGGGIFNLSKILAEGASLGAIMISWIISGTGLLSIALTFTTLNKVRPELTSGIYKYTAMGFGRYAGFNIAWGYWLGMAIGNVVLSVMLNDAFGLFFPSLLEHSWPTFIFASCFSWFFTLLVSRGLRIAAAINTISTIIKFFSLAFIIFLLFRYTHYDRMDFSFQSIGNTSVYRQINSTLLTTLFFFMGIEGAVILSSRARKQSEIGKATVIGFFICLVLNMMVCILPFGFISQAEMVRLNDPAIAQILGRGVGEWARIFVNISVIISVAGAWLVSTIIAAELPAEAATDQVLPHFFAKRDKHGAPIGALLITACFIQIFLIFIIKARNIYLLSLDISGIMILPTYILSALYLTKIAWKKQIYIRQPVLRHIAALIGMFAAIYCLWVIYVGHIRLFLFSSGLYIIGIFFYWHTHRHKISPSHPLFTRNEYYGVGLLIIALLLSFFLASDHPFPG